MDNNDNIKDQETIKTAENARNKVLEVKVKEELEKSFIAYAMAVNVSRAIPDIRDGLKPVHRRILYTMGGELNLFNDKPFKKCARIVGDVMGKFHPHGDSAIYDALVRLAQDFTINAPLVEGHGNFGSVDGDSPAAMRYTEARLSKISNEMLSTIDKETVDFYPNFDGTLQQPIVLPARFPNLLVNGSDGIAVGMATNIPPHNLGEVVDGVVALIDNKDLDIEELMRYIPAPDFPTKAYILGLKGVREAYRTGKGTFYIRAKADIEETPNGRSRIVVTEIPYQVNKAKLIMQIADLVKSKRIEGIADIKEESDREGLRIVIDIKKDANAQVVLNTLYKHTQLQISFGVIMLALVNGTPKICNLMEVVKSFLDFQKEIIIRRTKFDLDKAEQKAHILEGLVIAQANIDEVIRQIKMSEDKNDAIERLTKLFELTERQAQAILDMRLQKLTGLEVEKLKEDLEETHNLIKEYKSILESEEKVLAIIKEDLLTIKAKYGEPRKTEILMDYSDIDIADLIEKKDVVITLTHGGYVKRMPITEYKSQHRGGMGVNTHKTKEEDWVDNIFMTNTHDDLFCFSDQGKVYSIKAYEVPEAQKTAKGRAIVNIIQVDQGERITTIIPVNRADIEGKDLLMCTRSGMIKKTKLSEFENIRRSGKLAIRLAEGDSLIGVYVAEPNDQIILAASNGKCIRFRESDIRLVGRDAGGVRGMKLAEGEHLVDIVLLKDGYDIITVSANGYGKRSSQDDYRTQGRYGSGVAAGIFNEQTGDIISLKQISDDEDVMLICDDGQVIRLKATEIKTIGRNTKGVKLMQVKEGTKIVSIAVVPTEKVEASPTPSDELIADNATEDIVEELTTDSPTIEE